MLSCPTLCILMNCNPPGSSVHGISQARILEWVAISSSRGSFWPMDQTLISYSSCIAGRFFTTYTTREALRLHRPMNLRSTEIYVSSLQCTSVSLSNHKGCANPVSQKEDEKRRIEMRAFLHGMRPSPLSLLTAKILFIKEIYASYLKMQVYIIKWILLSPAHLLLRGKRY